MIGVVLTRPASLKCGPDRKMRDAARDLAQLHAGEKALKDVLT
jgi:hypothetical protein